MRVSGDSILLFTCLVAALLALSEAASPSKDAGEMVYFVFSKQCFNKFLSGNFFDVACLKITISKLLGFGIIAGACVVKLPQIIAFIRSSSVAGVSRGSTYFELVGYLLQSIYHIRGGSPFSAYGETVIVAIQALIVVLMIWGYSFPGGTEVAGVVAALAVIGQQALFTPKANLVYLQSAVTLLFIISRATQIVANFKQGGTGALAFLTLFMNFAGSAARIFTSSVEVKDKPEVLLSFVVSTVLNFILLVQYFYYRNGSKAAAAGGKKGKAAAATTTAEVKSSPAASPKGKKQEAAATAEEEEKENSGGGARPRRSRKQA